MYPDLKYIFLKITESILQKGQIEEIHETMFVQEIDKLIENRDKYKNPEKMGLYLYEYKNLFRIYIMENGEISRHGDHETLLQTENLYSRHWNDLVL